jgi:hypothetical protein
MVMREREKRGKKRGKERDEKRKKTGGKKRTEKYRGKTSKTAENALQIQPATTLSNLPRQQHVYAD